ncbi:MAG: hypothetical protein ACRDVC_09995 [Acidimicrobiales bacterium]
MSGSIRSRAPGVWEARVAAGRDPVTGKHRQISRTIRGNRRDAQKLLNEMVVEADRGQFKGTSTTFGQLSEDLYVYYSNYGRAVKISVPPAKDVTPINRIGETIA